MKKIVALISGRGSNLQAVVRAARAQAWPAHVAAVISNDPSAPGLAWAQSQGITTAAVSHRTFAAREAFDSALALEIERHQPDLIVLAGFMRILGGAFVERFAGRMVNIHPSLLPAFKGLHTHAQALAAGVKVHGATVHLVSPELDAGSILAQAVVPVLAGDDESSLAAAVLQAEHRLYPGVVGAIVRGELELSRTHGRWLPGARAADQGFWLERQTVAADDPRDSRAG